MHRQSWDNLLVQQKFLLLSAELTWRVWAALSKFRPRLGALRGVLGGEHGGVVGVGEHDGGGGLRCGALGFSRGGNALGFARCVNALGGPRGANESHDEDDDLVYGGGGGLGLGLGTTIGRVSLPRETMSARSAMHVEQRCSDKG